MFIICCKAIGATQIFHALVMRFVIFTASLTLSLFTISSESSTDFVLRAPSPDLDTRYAYEVEIFTLALEKTKLKYGGYTLSFAPKMNNLRAIDHIQKNKLENFFVILSYDSGPSRDGLIHIPFPVHLGILGYRICFSSEAVLEAVGHASKLEDLQTYVFGLGRGWGDVNVLRHNGFKVLELDNYLSLFKMTASSRIDLFCRGVHEYLAEQRAISSSIKLSVESKILLYYPYPRFLYTHGENQSNADRIHLGLKIAFDDGTLLKAWYRHFGESVVNAKLKSRMMLTLVNPIISPENAEYKKYMLDPFEISGHSPESK